MVNLYVASFEPYSGKTAICLGLGLHYKEKGVSIKYMKPVSTPALISGKQTSWDALFLKEKLGIKENTEDLSPVLISPENLEEMLKAPEGTWQDKIMESYKKLSPRCRLMLLEGATNLAQGYALKISAGHIARLLDAKVLLVMNYKSDLSVTLDEILHAREHLKGYLVGVMMNHVPAGVLDKTSVRMRTLLRRYRIPFTGILPEDPILSSIPVNELAEILGGEIICSSEECENLVENFAVGAMNVDQALTYFRRIPRKAVITGGDRADIQIAALETDTRCLILTGNRYPPQAILAQSAIQHVPVIIVSTSTMEAVRKVDETLGHMRLRHQSQINRLRQMIESQPGLRELSSTLDLPE